MLRSALLISLLLITTGATYYVATDGNNADPGTLGQPWATLSYAVKTHGYLNAGDTVYMRGGTYTGFANEIDIAAGAGNSGTSGSPITISAYQNERPIITGIDGTAFHYYAVVLHQKEYWNFNGITWSNNYSHLYLDSITNCVFTNCVFTMMPTNAWDLNASGYATVWLFGTSQLNRFLNCEFSYWGDVGNSDYKAHGSALSIGNETTDDQTWYNLWDGCTFSTCGHDLTTISAGYNIFRNGLYHNQPWYPTNSDNHLLYNGGAARYQENPYGAWGARIMKPGDAGVNQIDERNVWENNRMYYAGPPPDSGGAFGIELATHFSIYRNNTIAFTEAAGVFINTSGMTTLVRSNAFYNNVIFGCGLSWVYGGDWMKSYSYGLSMNTFEDRMTNNFILNNIIQHNYPANIDPTILIYQQFHSNLTNDIVDPLFVSTNGIGYVYSPANLPDFHLRNGSPCIDAGQFLATITSATGSGTSFTVDNSVFFSDGNRIAQGDTIQLQGQTVRAVVTSNDWTNNVLTFTPALTWTNGQGVSLAYSGSAPDQGAYEYTGERTVIHNARIANMR